MKARKEPPAITRSSAAEYLTYVASVGDTSESFEIRYADEDIWLTQKMLARLYGVEIPAISYHLKKLFADAEIDRDSVIKNFLITASDGKCYNTKHYNLQAVISIGFKVDNERAVQFRKWVNGQGNAGKRDFFEQKAAAV